MFRWRIVIHGGIDGFSRLVTFLKASDNNRSETMCDSFVRAIGMYGVPSRIRCDFGGENNDVCNIMEVLRGFCRGSAIRGSSTHNQRIERLRLDMRFGGMDVFYDVFTYMEEEHLLEPDNETHLWALHYVYLPKINASLECFRNQWNNHGLRTENHMTPIQLFVQYALSLQNFGMLGINDLMMEHGVISSNSRNIKATSNSERQEFEDPLVANEVQNTSRGTEQAVQVPAVQCPLTIEQCNILKQLPVFTNDIYGFDDFRRTLEFINAANTSH